MSKQPSPTLAVRLNEQDLATLKQLAKQLRLTESDTIRALIRGANVGSGRLGELDPVVEIVLPFRLRVTLDPYNKSDVINKDILKPGT